MKLYGIWTLLVAISISIVAAYYSIVGLAALFASALIPVIIMGTVLEISKITTTVWLHLNWKNAPILIKTYLTIATIVLMLITSMGIFGFLSKAHIQQTAVSEENVAILDQIDMKINDQNIIISGANDRIKELASSKDNNIQKIQAEIDSEQARVDKIVARIQPSIDEQNTIISQIETGLNGKTAEIDAEIQKAITELDTLKSEQTKLNAGDTPIDETALISKRSTLAQLKSQLTEIDSLFSNPTKENITKIQTIVGIVPADGINGKKTTAAIQAYRSTLVEKSSALEEEVNYITKTNAETKSNSAAHNTKRSKEIITEISTAETKLNTLKSERDTLLNTTDPRVVTARDNISKIRETVNDELNRSNTHINELRDNLSKVSQQSVDNEIADQRKIISAAKSEIDGLTKQKFQLQSELRKLEADVGPVKYIAELVYGDSTNKNTLETAVRWVILMLVFVFDPLAITLVLAGIRSLGTHHTITELMEIDDIPAEQPTIVKPKRKYTKKVKVQPIVDIPTVSEPEIQETQLELKLDQPTNKRKKQNSNQVTINSYSKEWENNERNQ